MNIQQAVRQAIATGAIAQTTLDQLGDPQDIADTRALVILQEAIDDSTVRVLVSR